MSKTYKLKRAYSVLKVLSALGIGAMTLVGFTNAVGNSYTSQDVWMLVIGLICTLYFAASYMKADMEKDDLMEKLTKAIAANKQWGKATKAAVDVNTIKIGKLESKRVKR